MSKMFWVCVYEYHRPSWGLCLRSSCGVPNLHIAIDVNSDKHEVCDKINVAMRLIYDKLDDFDFEIVNFPFLNGDVTRSRSTTYKVYISQLIRYGRASSYIIDFNTRNQLLTQKRLKQGFRYHKLRKTVFKFYRHYNDLISKFQVGLKSLLR